MNFTRIALLVIAFNLGVLAFFVLSYVPLPLPYSWNYIGIILFITLPLAFIMDMLIFERSHHDSRIGLAHACLVALYSVLFFSIHFEEAGNIRFNALAALAIMISSWVLSAIPFLYKDGKIALSRLDAKAKDYALFATSLMWYSPFFAELPFVQPIYRSLVNLAVLHFKGEPHSGHLPTNCDLSSLTR